MGSFAYHYLPKDPPWFHTGYLFGKLTRYPVVLIW